jgi:hypothetical protein
MYSNGKSLGTAEVKEGEKESQEVGPAWEIGERVESDLVVDPEVVASMPAWGRNWEEDATSLGSHPRSTDLPWLLSSFRMTEIHSTSIVCAMYNGMGSSDSSPSREVETFDNQ